MRFGHFILAPSILYGLSTFGTPDNNVTLGSALSDSSGFYPSSVDTHSTVASSAAFSVFIFVLLFTFSLFYIKRTRALGEVR